MEVLGLFMAGGLVLMWLRQMPEDFKKGGLGLAFWRGVGPIFFVGGMFVLFNYANDQGGSIPLTESAVLVLLWLGITRWSESKADALDPDVER